MCWLEYTLIREGGGAHCEGQSNKIKREKNKTAHKWAEERHGELGTRKDRSKAKE